MEVSYKIFDSIEYSIRCDEWICRLIDCKYFINRGKVTDIKIDKEE